MTDDLTLPGFLSGQARRDLRRFVRELPNPSAAAVSSTGDIINMRGGGSFTGPQTGESIAIKYAPESRLDIDGTYATTRTAITGVVTVYEGDDLQAAIDALRRAADGGLNDPADFA